MKDIQKQVYFENLDGLRAIAAFSVILFHTTRWFSFPPTAFYRSLKFVLSFGEHGGELGVVFFFILSGFLITYLMYVEQSESGFLNISFFYVRRILRIWPLYYLTLVVGFILVPLVAYLTGRVHTENANPFLYAIFAANFDHIYHGAPRTGILGVQWSVAIEEQFYFIWPLLFYFFSKKKAFPFLLLSIVLISELFYLNAENWAVKYYHLICNFRFLAFGGLLAYLIYFKKNYFLVFFEQLKRGLHAAIYCIGVALLLFEQQLLEVFPLYKYGYHFVPFVFFGFVIIEQNFSTNSFFKISSFSWLTWLGKISYGLYLTHMIAICLINELFTGPPEAILLRILLTVFSSILISYVSYRYMESFFLGLKRKFSSVQTVGFKVKRAEDTRTNEGDKN